MYFGIVIFRYLVNSFLVMNLLLLNVLGIKFQRFTYLYFFLMKFGLKVILLFSIFSISEETKAIVAPQTVPGVNSFTKNDYHAGSQNWNIAQDYNGILYFANKDGLLQYDGTTWKLHPMPNKMGLHSVAIDNNNRIYTGAYEEFGFWETSKDGSLVYSSLKGLLGNYKFTNDEIWRIVIIQNKVYFQSFGSYFVYDGKKVTPHGTPGVILFFLTAGNKVYTQGIQTGIFQLVNDSLVNIPNGDFFKNDLVYATLPLDSNRIVFGTASNGLFIYDTKQNRFALWKTEADEILKNGQINCGVLVSDSILCFGTIGNGAVAIDKNGKLLWHFYKDHSLLTNTVLNIFQDNQSNVWLALDKGIALIENNSPFKFIPVKTNNIELVYTAIQYRNSIYLGTNQGLYQLQSTNHENKLAFVPHTLGQVWQLSVIDDQLICGHNNGTFRIEDNNVINISNITGGSSLSRYSESGHEYLIQGTYTSLAVYTKNSAGYWGFSHVIQGFSNPVRFLETDHLGFIWAAHGVKGLFRIKPNIDLTEAIEIKSYNITNDPIGDSKINVFKVDNRIIFCSGEKIYTYDDLNDQIVPYTWLNNKLGEFATSHLILPVSRDSYWFVNDDKFGLFKFTKDDVKLLDIVPFSYLKNNFIDDYEYVASLDSNRFIFCLDNGLAIYDATIQKTTERKDRPIFFRQIRAISNKENFLLPIYSTEKEFIEIPYSFRQLTFSFAYPDFGSKKINFYYKLNGSADIPVDAQKLIKTFTNLPSNKYVLEILAKDEINGVLASAKYYFIIKPPIYASIGAYILYFISLILLFYIVRKNIQAHIHRQNEKAIEEQARIQQERIERREQKITLLKNEKLHAEVVHKSKELASATMAIIRKNDMLIMLKEEIEVQKQKLGTQYPNKYYENIVRLIDDNISSDGDWQIFQQNFDMIHENFFRHLKKQYHDLTEHDMKLCAYLRLNLSTKEIASLLNISIRGVEAARHRLRKKLRLPVEKNLYEFFVEFK